MIAVKKWIEDSGIKVMCDSDELIGIPVDFYFPEYKSVLILPKDFHNNYHGKTSAEILFFVKKYCTKNVVRV